MIKLPGPATMAGFFLSAVLTAWLGLWGPLIDAWSSRSLLLFFGVVLLLAASVIFPITKRERWIELANLFVVSAALIAAGFAAYWAYKQAESAERQAAAAQEQNTLAQDIGRRQIKSYVIFDDASLSFASDKSAYFVEVRVKNSGTSPAFNLVWNWEATVVTKETLRSTMNDYPCTPVRDRESYDLAGSKDIALGSHRAFRLADGQYEQITRGELTVQVVACFDYLSFGKRQNAYFKLVNSFTPNRSKQSEEAEKLRLFFHSMSDY